MKTLCFSTVALGLFLVPSFAQDEDDDAKKPEPAYLRIVNATTVDSSEPWKAGVDLSFKDSILAKDIRGGEAAGYKKIYFKGKDRVEVRATGETRVLGDVPASFVKGSFYSIYLTGDYTDATFKVTPMVVRDFPVPKEKVRQGYARVAVFNAISGFPVKLALGEGKGTVLPPMAFTDLYLPGGAQRFRLLFPFRDKGEREMRGMMILGANSQYSAVVYASPEKPDRPVLRLLEDSTGQRDVIEEERVQEEEKKNPPPAPDPVLSSPPAEQG